MARLDGVTPSGYTEAMAYSGERGASEIVVFGRRVVGEALRLPSIEPLELRMARRVPGPLRHELSTSARARGVEAEVVRDADVAALSREPRHDQGLALRLRLQRLMEVDGFLATRTGAGARAPARVLALDGLTNSQNLGMIVRSAVASGMDALLWPRVGCPWLNGLVVKASAGTALRAPIVRCQTVSEGLAALQGAGFICVGVEAGAAKSLHGYAPPHRLAVVLGSETAGLSDETRALLDASISIPMKGEVESLNVAVAASLVCYELMRFDSI